VDLKVMVPSGDVITVQVKRNSPTPEVQLAVMEKTRYLSFVDFVDVYFRRKGFIQNEH
jgi:hypothetical protein